LNEKNFDDIILNGDMKEIKSIENLENNIIFRFLNNNNNWNATNNDNNNEKEPKHTLIENIIQKIGLFLLTPNTYITSDITQLQNITDLNIKYKIFCINLYYDYNFKSFSYSFYFIYMRINLL